MNGKMILSSMFLAVVLIGCASTKVSRVEVNRPIDLSGGWNDYDAQLVSQEMITDCLDKPWLTTHMKEKQKNPVVIVGHIENRSDEHINTQVFTKELERSLLNSGKVNFVASPQERDQVREEREDQQRGNTSPESLKKMGRELGADFMLIGSLNSVKDEVKGKMASFYQANLELINLETNEKVWIGQKEIKKMIEQKRFSL